MDNSTTAPPASPFYRTTGLLGAGLCSAYFIFLAIALRNPGFALQASRINPLSFIILGIFTLLFLFSGFRHRWVFLQPVILLVLTPMPIAANRATMFSLGHFLAGCILLDRMDFFSTRRSTRSMLLVGYYLACETLIGLSMKLHPAQILLPAVFIIIAFIFFNTIAGSRTVIYKDMPKPELSLSGLGITKKEAEYLRCFLAGRSIKEIASEKAVTESTVRNTMSRIYRKFGVTDKAGLLAKCENFSIVD